MADPGHLLPFQILGRRQLARQFDHNHLQDNQLLQSFHTAGHRIKRWAAPGEKRSFSDNAPVTSPANSPAFRPDVECLRLAVTHCGHHG